MSDKLTWIPDDFEAMLHFSSKTYTREQVERLKKVAVSHTRLIITGLTDEQSEVVTRIVEQLGGKVENE